MSMTPSIIGVVASRYEAQSGAIMAGVAINYLRGVEAGGAVPLLIHLTEDTQVLEALYQRCDALLFTGGGDVDPAHFGMAAHPMCGAPYPLRDTVELWLARRAVAEAKPIMGICRGIQLINIAMGGTLYQDIPSELPSAHDHYASRNAPGRSHLAHSIQIETDSWLAQQLGVCETMVNTFHHQALRDLASGLRVVARAPDGVIEAVEGTGDGFVIGVQCHPEDLWELEGSPWLGLFRGFAQQTSEHSLLRYS